MTRNETGNDVVLIGHLTGIPTERELPSGEVVVNFRLAVPRAESGSDTIDVAVRAGRLRRTALALKSAHRIRVVGALRHRFFRAGGALMSRYEVEAQVVERL